MFCCTTERYFISVFFSSSFIQLLSYGQYVSPQHTESEHLYTSKAIYTTRNEAFLIVEIESENEKMEKKRDEM